MKEVKSPKKPLIYYYVLVLAILCLFNLIVSPMLMRPQIDEVDYGTFMDMIEEKDVGVVEVTSTEITFTNKDNTQVYQTGAMYDPTLTERLHEAGATFDSVSDQGSPILSFLLSFVLPLAIFIGLGQYMSKKMMEQMGGKNSMSFGMGKSNSRARISMMDSMGSPFSMKWQGLAYSIPVSRHSQSMHPARMPSHRTFCSGVWRCRPFSSPSQSMQPCWAKNQAVSSSRFSWGRPRPPMAIRVPVRAPQVLPQPIPAPKSRAMALACPWVIPISSAKGISID